MAKTTTIQVRVTDLEKARIAERAVAAGLKVSEYVRLRALGRPLKGPRPIAGLSTQNAALTPEGEVVKTLPGQTSVEENIVAAEVEEAKLVDEEAQTAFVARRTLQLQGQGRTSLVARREAEAEWRARAS